MANRRIVLLSCLTILSLEFHEGTEYVRIGSHYNHVQMIKRYLGTLVLHLSCTHNFLRVLILRMSSISNVKVVTRQRESFARMPPIQTVKDLSWQVTNV